MYALFASSFTMGKLALNYTTPIFMTGMRFTIAGVILLAYQYWAPHEQFKFRKKHIWLYTQMVILGVFVTYTLRFWALNYMPSSKLCFMYNLSPFLASLYSYFFFDERMTPARWAGLAIGFVGLTPILLSHTPDEAAFGQFGYISWPELAALVSIATHSYSWVLMRKFVKFKNYAPMMINGLSFFCGGLLAIITSYFVEGFAPVSDWQQFTGWLMGVVIISNVICYNMYGFLLKKYSATFLSFAGFLGPLFAALYGWALLGERITWHFYLSSVIVFVGLYIFYRDEMKTLDPTEVV